MKNDKFRVLGQVIDQRTKFGVHDLNVEAWDKDLIFNDLVGSTTTTNDGRFVIVFDSSKFSELFIDRKPDLFFKVYFKSMLIKDTSKEVLWNVDAGDKRVTIEVDMPDINVKQKPEVSVFNHKQEVLKEAKVHLVSSDGGQISVELKYDSRSGKYIGPELEFGKYILQVNVEGLEADQREVILGPYGLKETFFIGKKGLPYYFRGKVKVPFEPPEDRIAVSVKGKRSAEFEKQLEEIFAREKLPLEIEDVGDTIKQSNLRVLKLPAGTNEEAKANIQRQLEKQAMVKYVGPVLHLNPKNVAILTNELVVRCNPKIDQAALSRILAPYGLNIKRKLSYAPNTYIVNTKEVARLKLLETELEILKHKDIEVIEPNLVSNAIVNYTPNDYQFANQPHHPIINTEEAWDISMGDRDIIVAVVDNGCDIDHPDLTNDASAGWTKVYAPFDFTDMDTEPTSGSHGTKSCGMVTANADNNEGIAGVAPGCTLMPIRWSSGTISDWADLYMWIAGFDPGSTDPSFPAPISPGADVISNSIGVWDTPMSTVMENAFDYITNNGRGGKGCVVLFAAGNDDSDLTTIGYSQWAAYNRTIAVASSVISPPDAAEIKVSTSNYGAEIDVCAPGGGPSWGTEARTLSSTNVGAGDTAGSASATTNDYDDFGQTSCACPQVAGTAALILSVASHLDWSEVRQIIRDTAVQIDAGNTDPIGQWTGGFSQWYGYGRINVQAAVEEAEDRPHFPPFERIPERVGWLVEGFIVDRRTWVMYLIINYLRKDYLKYAEIQPDSKFYSKVSTMVEGYMREGVEPPQEIATAVYNIADDITTGRDVVLKMGDYISLQSYIRGHN